MMAALRLRSASKDLEAPAGDAGVVAGCKVGTQKALAGKASKTKKCTRKTKKKCNSKTKNKKRNSKTKKKCNSKTKNKRCTGKTKKLANSKAKKKINSKTKQRCNGKSKKILKNKKVAKPAGKRPREELEGTGTVPVFFPSAEEIAELKKLSAEVPAELEAQKKVSPKAAAAVEVPKEEPPPTPAQRKTPKANAAHAVQAVVKSPIPETPQQLAEAARQNMKRSDTYELAASSSAGPTSDQGASGRICG
jgi:hypothetical protein